jgi:uncharacterized protein
MNNPEGLDFWATISFIASVASLILAIISIWISYIFYKMGNSASENAAKNSQEMHESVTKMEKLFNTMYNDTFNMMRETVTNMQKHIWPEKLSDATATNEIVQEKTDQRIAELKQQMTKELSALFTKQKSGNAQVESLARDLVPMLDKAINESNKVTVQTREETIREAIMTVILDLARNHIYTTAADEMVGRIDKKYALSFGDTLVTLKKLRDEGFIYWEGPDYALSSNQINISPEILKKVGAR